MGLADAKGARGPDWTEPEEGKAGTGRGGCGALATGGGPIRLGCRMGVWPQPACSRSTQRHRAARH